LEDSLDRTWEIAQRCHVDLQKIKEPFQKFEASNLAAAVFGENRV
jgi:hypothetical protein